MSALPSSSSQPATPSLAAPRPQQLDETALRRHLRRLAHADSPPWLHEEVAGRMAERLAIVKLQPGRVLQWAGLLGGGGAALKAAYPAAQQLDVELLPQLRELARARHKRGWWQALQGGSALTVLSAEELAGQAGAQPVQLVWANMVLHASPDLPATLAAWHAALQVDGFLMFSCLGPDSLVELRPLFAAEGWGRSAPDWWDMHDIGDLLVQAGFADPVMDQERIQLTWLDAGSLLKDLRALGGNLAPDRFAGCRGRAWKKRLLQALEGLRAPDGRLHLSLEIVYGHAFKPLPKVRVSAETSLSLEQMRAMVRRSGA